MAPNFQLSESGVASIQEALQKIQKEVKSDITTGEKPDLKALLAALNYTTELASREAGAARQHNTTMWGVVAIVTFIAIVAVIIVTFLCADEYRYSQYKKRGYTKIAGMQPMDTMPK